VGRQAHHLGLAAVALYAVAWLGRPLYRAWKAQGAAALRSRLADSRSDYVFVLATLHLAFSLPLLLTTGKSGSNYNYLI
jgi:predicted lysophospholipase L1 biosynthesis ABC-type transport system permease subunit